MRLSTMIAVTVILGILGYIVLSCGIRALDAEMTAKNASYAEAMQ